MKFSRRFRWVIAILGLIGVPTTLLMGGCALFKDWKHLPTDTQDEKTIYVVSHGWHTGIVVARQELSQELEFIPRALGESAFYEFGWGDKGFYQADEITISIAAKAVLWPTPSVMHVVAVPSEPADYFPDSKTIALHVSTLGHRYLTAEIAKSFAKNAHGESNGTRPGLYGHSLFFDGVGSYYMTNTCNTWTARVLQSAGVPVTDFLTLTAGSVMRQSKWAVKKYSCCHNKQLSR